MKTNKEIKRFCVTECQHQDCKGRALKLARRTRSFLGLTITPANSYYCTYHHSGTTIQAARTVSEIQAILQYHGARSILTNYDKQGQIESLAFQIETPHGTVGIQLPIHPEAVMKVLERQRLSSHMRKHIDRDQAVRIAWRIVKDWVEAQMAILETEMVELEQIFLPYIMTKNNQSLFEVYISQQNLLTEGANHE